MKHFYTVFFIRKSDNKLLRRFDTGTLNKFMWKQEVENQLLRLLNNYVDLERRDIIIKEYEGRVDNYD